MTLLLLLRPTSKLKTKKQKTKLLARLYYQNSSLQIVQQTFLNQATRIQIEQRECTKLSSPRTERASG